MTATVTKRLAPQGERLLVRRQKPPGTTDGGIHLPDVAKEVGCCLADVLAVGNVAMTDDKWKVSIVTLTGYLVGDVILMMPYAGQEVEFGGEKLLMVRTSEVLAIVKEE